MTVIWSDDALDQLADGYTRLRSVEDQRELARLAEEVTRQFLRDPWAEGESRETDNARVWTHGRLTVSYQIRVGATVEIWHVFVSLHGQRE